MSNTAHLKAQVPLPPTQYHLSNFQFKANFRLSSYMYQMLLHSDIFKAFYIFAAFVRNVGTTQKLVQVPTIGSHQVGSNLPIICSSAVKFIAHIHVLYV